MHPRGTGFILNVLAVTKQLSFLTGKGAAPIGLKPVKTTADCSLNNGDAYMWTSVNESVLNHIWTQSGCETLERTRVNEANGFKAQKGSILMT